MNKKIEKLKKGLKSKFKIDRTQHRLPRTTAVNGPRGLTLLSRKCPIKSVQTTGGCSAVQLNIRTQFWTIFLKVRAFLLPSTLQNVLNPFLKDSYGSTRAHGQATQPFLAYQYRPVRHRSFLLGLLSHVRRSSPTSPGRRGARAHSSI